MLWITYKLICLFCFSLIVANPHSQFFLRFQACFFSPSLCSEKPRAFPEGTKQLYRMGEKNVLYIKLSGAKFMCFGICIFIELRSFSTLFQLISEFAVLRRGLIRFTSNSLNKLICIRYHTIQGEVAKYINSRLVWHYHTLKTLDIIFQLSSFEKIKHVTLSSISGKHYFDRWVFFFPTKLFLMLEIHSQSIFVHQTHTHSLNLCRVLCSPLKFFWIYRNLMYSVFILWIHKIFSLIYLII